MTRAQQADAIVRAVGTAYRTGLEKFGMGASDVQAIYEGRDPSSLVLTKFTTYADRTVLAQMKALGPRIHKWATVYRGWALAGRRDDGSAYTFEQWAAHGLTPGSNEDLASAIRQHLGTIVDGSAWRVVKDAVKETVTEVRHVVDPTQWGTATKVGVGLGAALLAYAVLRR